MEAERQAQKMQQINARVQEAFKPSHVSKLMLYSSLLKQYLLQRTYDHKA